MPQLLVTQLPGCCAASSASFHSVTLHSINLPEWLRELRETFYLRHYLLTIKEGNSGTARWLNRGPQAPPPCPGGLKCLTLMPMSTLRDSVELVRKKEGRLEALQVYLKTGGVLFITHRVTVARGKH